MDRKWCAGSALGEFTDTGSGTAPGLAAPALKAGAGTEGQQRKPGTVQQWSEVGKRIVPQVYIRHSGHFSQKRQVVLPLSRRGSKAEAGQMVSVSE